MPARKRPTPQDAVTARRILLDEVTWWQTDDFWQYALYAAAAYIRAAASRTGVPVRQVCRELAERAGSQPG